MTRAEVLQYFKERQLTGLQEQMHIRGDMGIPNHMSTQRVLMLPLRWALEYLPTGSVPWIRETVDSMPIGMSSRILSLSWINDLVRELENNDG